jgi:zinc finger protein
MSETKSFFPSIGSLAHQTDNSAQEADSAQVSDATEDKVVQQIESLCMKCGEQVRKFLLLETPLL